MDTLFTEKTFDTIRLDEKALATLYTGLDKRGGASGLPRDNDGFRTKPIPALLNLVGRDAQIRPYRASVRSLSETWCTILIGMYIHPDQRASITFPTSSGEMQVFEATVAACAHVADIYHEVRLEVETAIEVVEFIGFGPGTPANKSGSSSSLPDASLMPPSADISQLLDALSAVVSDEKTLAVCELVQIIMRQAERFRLPDVRKTAEALLIVAADRHPEPAELALLDASVQALAPRAA